MREPHALRRIAALACIAMLGALVGCPPAGGAAAMEPFAPRSAQDARAAVERINANAAKLSMPIQAKPATVSMRFRDSNQQLRNFVAQPATLIFGPPRCLYFDVKSLAGSVAHIGCDDERYWLWIDLPEARRLWWGTWRGLERGTTRSLMIRPDQLLDALMLRPIPARLQGGIHPVFVASGGAERLVFPVLQSDGWFDVRRVVTLDSAEPRLPVEITDYDSGGDVLMRVVLRDYRRLDDGGPNAPYTPRRYVIQWPKDDAEMRLDFDRVRARRSDAPFCEFPEDWKGDVEPLDSGPLPLAPAEPSAGGDS